MAAGIPVRLFYFETPKEVCLHNNKQRSDNKHRDHHSMKLPSFVIRDFFKNKEMPTMDEGYSQIVRIPFKEKFVNKDDERAYH